VIAVNTGVVDAPEKVNADAYANWLYKVKPSNPADVAKLLDAAGYIKTVGES
jgi:glycine cleavage system H protein